MYYSWSNGTAACLAADSGGPSRDHVHDSKTDKDSPGGVRLVESKAALNSNASSERDEDLSEGEKHTVLAWSIDGVILIDRDRNIYEEHIPEFA